MTSDAKREQLREKIEAGERRNEERSLADAAREAADSATNFVKQHPLATLGGAVVVGLAIGAMTKPGRRLTKRGGVLAGLIADAAIAYGISMIDKAGDVARDGQDRLEDLGDVLSDKARSARRDANYLAGSASDRTRSLARGASRKASRAVRDLKGRVSP
ncbi:hypothetical protein P7228_13430 [Altererythrobacter arenosus]|uniref:DUF883 family protein n=1 Tax=Altererythrobacter arenosus TaxID=3032592 RepID=A0ABY8FQ60_9SPHN|nr:hypothetical protein [Altererythrobacter sp. CAU 1644]WFL76982.1 hypothetical protein P7228_13430 [Altererythrobacter sp. CAU 1644]